MTTCYLFPVGQNEISRKGKELGWHKKHGQPMKLDHEGYAQTRNLARQLREKGATLIYCADVHFSTAKIIKHVLDIPIEIDEKLRPFNPGSGLNGCRPVAAINDMLKGLVEKWKAKPELPIYGMHGGDSLISYRTRLLKGVEPILNSGATVILVSDARNMRFLRNRVPESLVEDHSIRPDRIYILRREDSDAHSNKQNSSVDIGASGPSSGPIHARVPEVAASVS